VFVSLWGILRYGEFSANNALTIASKQNDPEPWRSAAAVRLNSRFTLAVLHPRRASRPKGDDRWKRPDNENGFWYETAHRERANRKIIEYWLAKCPSW
jgi:hypothetical protein